MTHAPSVPVPDPSPYITLAQFIKKLQLADSGGAAKHLARTGAAQVNGQQEQRPGRKLRAGDTVTIQGQHHVVSLERDEPADEHAGGPGKA